MIPQVQRAQLDLQPVNWAGIETKSARARFLHPGEMEAIAALIRSAGARRVVEFGCQNGRTARVLLDSIPEIESYVGIDVLAGYVTEKEVQRNEVPAEPGEHALGDRRFRLIVRERGSHDVSADEIGPVDAAFIDGDHSRAGVENDFALVTQCVRPGGIAIFHDYHDLGTVDVKPVLDEFYGRGVPLVHVAGTWLVYTRL